MNPRPFSPLLLFPFAMALLLLCIAPAARAQRLDQLPRTNQITGAAASNIVLVTDLTLGTNGSQMFPLPDFATLIEPYYSGTSGVSIVQLTTTSNGLVAFTMTTSNTLFSTLSGGSGGSVDPTNAVLANIIGTGAVTNQFNRWLFWINPVNTNSFFAENRGLGITTNSTDFGALMQSVLNRGVDGFQFELVGSPYFQAHYVVSNTITITNFGTIIGDGNPSTVIRGRSGMTTAIFQAGTTDNFVSGINRFSHLRFEGEGTSAGSVGVHVVNTAEPVFEDCEWTGFQMAGIRVSTLYNTAWAYAEDCWFVQKASTAHGILFDREPSVAVSQNHFSIKDCIFGNHTTGGSAITVSNRFPALVIQGSHFRNYPGADGFGVMLYAGGDFNIQGNQFNGFSGAFGILFADRASATNYSSVVLNNTAWTEGIGVGHSEIVYIGENVQGIFLGGNQVRGGTAGYIESGVNNGPINSFDNYGLRIGSLAQTNTILSVDGNGLVKPTALSGLTFDGTTLTATASSGTNNPVLFSGGTLALIANQTSRHQHATNASFAWTIAGSSNRSSRFAAVFENTSTNTIYATNVSGIYDTTQGSNAVTTLAIPGSSLLPVDGFLDVSNRWVITHKPAEYSIIFGTGITPATNHTARTVTITASGGSGSSAFNSTNITVSATNEIVVDVAAFDLVRVKMLTNLNVITFSNASTLTRRAQLYFQQDTNGTREILNSRVIGGVLQLATNSTLALTTNANAADLLEVMPGFFDTNLFAWWPQNFHPRIAFTNSLASGVVTANDTFDRTDASPMSTTMSDAVGTWVSGPGAWGDCRIVSNELGATGGTRGANVSSPAFSANQIATVTLGSSGNASFGAVVRSQGDADASGYMAYLGSSTQITIYRIDDTGSIALTALGGTIAIAALSAGDTLGLGISGTTLTAYTNGVSTGTTRTDATYATGRPGVYFGSSTPTINTFSATTQ